VATEVDKTQFRMGKKLQTPLLQNYFFQEAIMRKKQRWLAGSLVALAVLPAAFAQSGFDLGKREYEASCASCHGSAGKGDGALRQHLVKAPADLTTLVKRNGGVFPTQRVWEAIDGRGSTQVGAHGTRDMPIWGNVFRAEDTQPYELHVRTRISALVDYLSRLQEK
jgi:mono/diheme cytochrome c family protein